MTIVQLQKAARTSERRALTIPHRREPMILRYSASENAFRVSVEIFPSEPSDRVNFAQASSLGNSEIRTASYWPIVRYHVCSFPPSPSAVFLAASRRDGLSLIFEIPC